MTMASLTSVVRVVDRLAHQYLCGGPYPGRDDGCTSGIQRTGGFSDLIGQTGEGFCPRNPASCRLRPEFGAANKPHARDGW